MDPNEIQAFVRGLDKDLESRKFITPPGLLFALDARQGLIIPSSPILSRRSIVCELEVEQSFTLTIQEEVEQIVFQKPNNCKDPSKEDKDKFNGLRLQWELWAEQGLLDAAGYLDLGWVNAWLGNEKEATQKWKKGKDMAAYNSEVRKKLKRNS